MPTATRMTAEDLLRMPDEGRGYELVNGDLREKVMSQESSQIGGEFLGLLREHIRPRKLGVLFPSDVGFQCFPDDSDRVRRPDVGFVRRERLTKEQYESRGYCRVVPDIVVEVLSPNDANSDIHEKRLEWLQAGVKLVVIVDPGDETVHVYSSETPPKHYNTIDTLALDPVLPGFSIPVSALFELPPLG